LNNLNRGRQSASRGCNLQSSSAGYSLESVVHRQIVRMPLRHSCLEEKLRKKRIEEVQWA
jgi:hypothetical protein